MRAGAAIPNYKSATRDVDKLLGELSEEKVDGVIVDLRNNGGGSLDEATDLTGLFIDKGPVVQIRTRAARWTRKSRQPRRASPGTARWRCSSIVLRLRRRRFSPQRSRITAVE